MQYTRGTIRVEMRDRLGRTTAILHEIVGPESETDYQRLAKRTRVKLLQPAGAHYEQIAL